MQETAMIKIDKADITTIITFLEGDAENYKIINYIKKYIYNPDYEKANKKVLQ